MTTPYEVRPVGHVESTLVDRRTAPEQGFEGAPDAWLVFVPEVAEAIRDLAVGTDVLVLTWLHRARRDVLTVHPRDDPRNPETGVFSTRSRDRPNPIGLHRSRSPPSTGSACSSGTSKPSTAPPSWTSSRSWPANAEGGPDRPCPRPPAPATTHPGHPAPPRARRRRLCLSADPGRRAPYLVPLSFLWDGATLLIATPASARTGRNLQATGRVRVGIGPTRDVVLIVKAPPRPLRQADPRRGRRRLRRQDRLRPAPAHPHLPLLPHPPPPPAGLARSQRAQGPRPRARRCW